MTTRIPFLVPALLACAAAAAHAQQPAASSNSPEADASLYGQSVVLPREAAVCSERAPDYAARFQRAFDAWRAENAQRLEIGRKFVRDSAAKGGVDADAGAARLGDAEVERLRKTTPELLARHCELMLESLAPPSN